MPIFNVPVEGNSAEMLQRRFGFEKTKNEAVSGMKDKNK